MHEISEALKVNWDKNGNPRKWADADEKARKAVGNAIATFYSRLEKKGMPNLLEHLRNHIKSGKFLQYNPPQDLHWYIQV